MLGRLTTKLMDAASKDSRLQPRRDGGVLMQRMVRRPSPRNQVTNHLLNLGYKLNDEDIVCVHGGAHKRLNDILECWHVECLDANDNKVSIYSGHTLTTLAAGLAVEKNDNNTCLYGDFVAVPKRRTPNRPSSATGAGRKVRTTLWADNHTKQSNG